MKGPSVLERDSNHMDIELRPFLVSVHLAFFRVVFFLSWDAHILLMYEYGKQSAGFSFKQTLGII